MKACRIAVSVVELGMGEANIIMTAHLILVYSGMMTEAFLRVFLPETSGQSLSEVVGAAATPVARVFLGREFFAGGPSFAAKGGGGGHGGGSAGAREAAGWVSEQLLDHGLRVLELCLEAVDEVRDALYLVSHDGHGGGCGL